MPSADGCFSDSSLGRQERPSCQNRKNHPEIRGQMDPEIVNSRENKDLRRNSFVRFRTFLYQLVRSRTIPYDVVRSRTFPYDLVRSRTFLRTRAYPGTVLRFWPRFALFCYFSARLCLFLAVFDACWPFSAFFQTCLHPSADLGLRAGAHRSPGVRFGGFGLGLAGQASDWSNIPCAASAMFWALSLTLSRIASGVLALLGTERTYMLLTITPRSLVAAAAAISSANPPA